MTKRAVRIALAAALTVGLTLGTIEAQAARPDPKKYHVPCVVRPGVKCDPHMRR